MASVEELTSALEATRVSPTGVSFAGKVLKPNSEEDAKPICEEIDWCRDLNYLNLEGNSIGVEAAKAIAKSLEKHPEFKRALWKDMFTGRMKEEIPKALEHFGNGLVTAGARLVELDLSDNAFGPIGMRGLAAFLKSSSCYVLEELRLNNNGLGITGGKLLASALTSCYNSSSKEGKTLALRVFIAGRNRLENEGATELAKVFKLLGSLEEIAMPQNGIYHVGISALSEAFTHNKNLRVINLNDNTITARGAEALSKALPHLQELREINFGDCLLKTKGVKFLCEALQNGHENLEELNLDHNEIRQEGGIEVVKALHNKSKLRSVNLNGNMFGDEGVSAIQEELKNIGKINVLESLSEDEYDSEGSEENDNVDEEDEDEDNETKDDEEVEEEENKDALGVKSVQDFLASPTPENFMSLGESGIEMISDAAKGKDGISLDVFIPILMNVSSLSTNNKENIAKMSLHCSEILYEELFKWSKTCNNSWLVVNSVLVNTGLIKGEDKNFKPKWNVESCRYTLQNVLEKPFIDQTSRETLQLFLQKATNGNSRKQ